MSRRPERTGDRFQSTMKKVVLFIVLPMLLVIGSGAALFFSGILSPEVEDESDGQKKPKPAVVGVYYDVPDFIINLQGPTNKVVFLQLKLNLELKREEEIERCKANLARLQDVVVTYFHRQEPDKLLDDPGFVRMREDLAQRMRAVAKPPLEILSVNISDLRIQ